MNNFPTNINCPYCKIPVPIIIDETAQGYHISFFPHANMANDDSLIEISYYRCHNCHKYFLVATGVGSAVENVHIMFHPQSAAIKYPDTVPSQIRQDYEEACSIIDRSPKACATLARRCMQGILRDRWDAHGKSLYDEIDSVKNVVPENDWMAMHALRQTGNIGAHMEQDVNLIIDIDNNEAQLILQMVEYLIQHWYIDIPKNNQTLSDVIELNKQKQHLRHKND